MNTKVQWANMQMSLEAFIRPKTIMLFVTSHIKIPIRLKGKTFPEKYLLSSLANINKTCAATVLQDFTILSQILTIRT